MVDCGCKESFIDTFNLWFDVPLIIILMVSGIILGVQSRKIKSINRITEKNKKNLNLGLDADYVIPTGHEYDVPQFMDPDEPHYAIYTSR